MNSSESGRKLNQAVNTTSRAVGGAISHAKGALTNWWSSLSTTTNNTNNGTSGKINNGTTLNEYNHIANSMDVENKDDEKAELSQVKNLNENNKINCDGDSKTNDFESLEMQQEFTSLQTSDDVGGIVEIGIEAMILQSK